MKTALLATALIGTTAWAAFATWQWKTATAPVANTSPLLADEAIADLERVAFLRQFADQYFNYDENTYWRNHAALTALMASNLRAKKLAELSAQKGKRRTLSFSQTSHLNGIRRRTDGSYQLNGRVHGREGEKTWALAFETSMRLTDVRRSLENPWGLEVEALDVKTSAPSKNVEIPSLELSEGIPVAVTFPCLVEQVETPPDLPVRIKIISLRTSEIQFVRNGPLEKSTVTALCRDRRFPLELATSEKTSDLFAGLEGPGRPRVEAARRRQEPYLKTLEQELGFIIQE